MVKLCLTCFCVKKKRKRSHICETSVSTVQCVCVPGAVIWEGAGSVKIPGVWKAGIRWPLTPGQRLRSLSQTLACSKEADSSGASRGDLLYHSGHVAELQRRIIWRKMVCSVYPCRAFFFLPSDRQRQQMGTSEKRGIVAKCLYTSSGNLSQPCIRTETRARSSAVPERQSARGCLWWLCSSSWKTRRRGSTSPAANKRVALHFI